MSADYQHLKVEQRDMHLLLVTINRPDVRNAFNTAAGLEITLTGCTLRVTRAVAVALRSRGVHVTLHARRPEQAREVAAALGVHAGGWPPAPGTWDLLINTTPVGGAAVPDAAPIPGGMRDGRRVDDLTYGRGESPLVRAARKAGCITLDGLAMLVAQAERQFEWWTGQRPRPGVMRDACGANPPGARDES